MLGRAAAVLRRAAARAPALPAQQQQTRHMAGASPLQCSSSARQQLCIRIPRRASTAAAPVWRRQAAAAHGTAECALKRLLSPGVQLLTTCAGGHGHGHGVEHGGLTLHPPAAWHTNVATGMSALMWCACACRNDAPRHF